MDKILDEQDLYEKKNRFLLNYIILLDDPRRLLKAQYSSKIDFLLSKKGLIN